VPRAYLGTAAAMNSTGRNIGTAMGFALAGAIFVARAAAQAGVTAGANLNVETLPPDAILAEVWASLFVAMIVAVLGMGAAFIRGSGVPSGGGEPSEPHQVFALSE